MTTAHYPALSETLIAQMIALIGRDSFAADLADLLAGPFGYRSFHIFLYHKHDAPAALASFPEPTPHLRGLTNYLNYTYVINPAYRAFQIGKPAGVYMISDFFTGDSRTMPDNHALTVHIEDSEPIGYRTPGWPKNMAEVIALVNLPNDTALDFSFLTPLGSRETQACRGAVKKLFPILNSVLLRQFALNPGSLDAANSGMNQETRFHDFGEDTLTEREREIVQLVLIGHSSSSIALNLGISLPTVKTHRRNIYTKLDISSQAELFSLFLLHLK
jgi:DNA-binding CsgD family transcriptional regulator